MNLTGTKEPQKAVKEQNSHVATWAPPVDVYETKDAYMLRADMPGVSKEGLDITVEDCTLTLVGKRSVGSQALEYRRVFELDPVIDYGKVKAHIDQGVLTVELPKAEKVKPRKIAITE